MVASRAEAWIETTSPPKAETMSSVASRAEAWIETALIALRTNSDMESPPVRRRGLKLYSVTHKLAFYENVASRAEAWIETRQTL